VRYDSNSSHDRNPPVSLEIAHTYQSLDDTDRDRLQAQVTRFPQSITLRRENAIDDLSQIMDDLGAEATRNGLTPAILESILNEPEEKTIVQFQQS
jgi:hypothetical protein